MTNINSKKKITIVGSGYVGLSLGVLFSRKHKVTILDIDKDKIKKINQRQEVIFDKEILHYFKKHDLDLNGTLSKKEAYRDAEYIIIATPTNYDSNTNFFDTTSVDCVIRDAINLNNDALIVIKSTIPVGYTKKIQKKYENSKIIFSPEFLREGNALHDNLYPSRIIVGSESTKSKKFAELLQKSSKKDNISILITSSTEAEAIKLFANTYLAMRIAFFNELDTFALTNDLNSKNLINGICLDDRIGHGYNNPSFGYGGYCLPKDTKQLLSNYNKIPQTLIKAIVSSNDTRIDFIADQVLDKDPQVVGIYRLVMKSNSDNFRSSAIQGVLNKLEKSGVQIIIFEPKLTTNSFNGFKVINDIEKFKEQSSLILANRVSVDLDDVNHKLFTRDIFGEN